MAAAARAADEEAEADSTAKVRAAATAEAAATPGAQAGCRARRRSLALEGGFGRLARQLQLSHLPMEEQLEGIITAVQTVKGEVIPNWHG